MRPGVISKGSEDDAINAGEEENVAEAVKAANTALNKTQIPSSVQKILSDEQCINLKEKNPFWIMAAALKEFVNKEGIGSLPVRGTLPDMTSDSQRYIALQNVSVIFTHALFLAALVSLIIIAFRYREQASKDSEHVYRHVQSILKEHGWSGDLVNENDVKLFCKHSAELRIIRGRCLAAEIETKSLPGVQDIGNENECSCSSLAI